jgi:hypothetical protein
VQRHVGGVLAALCTAAAASGVLAIALLAPPTAHPTRGGAAGGAARSGWPIGVAFSSPRGVSWLADDPNASAIGAGSGTGTAAPLPASAPAPVPSAVQAPAPAPTPSPSGSPTETFVAQTSGPPVAGEATGYGCAAALDYMSKYAAPGFWLVCPGYARGHQAETVCQSGASLCSVMRIIVIADPCPNAYMNEASNSWVMEGASDAPLDPYGACA